MRRSFMPLKIYLMTLLVALVFSTTFMFLPLNMTMQLCYSSEEVDIEDEIIGSYRKIERGLDQQEMEMKSALHSFDKQKNEQISSANGNKKLLKQALEEYENSLRSYQKILHDNLKKIYQEGQLQLLSLKKTTNNKSKNLDLDLDLEQILNQRISYYQKEIKKRIKNVLQMIVIEEKKYLQQRQQIHNQGGPRPRSNNNTNFGSGFRFNRLPSSLQDR